MSCFLLIFFRFFQLNFLVFFLRRRLLVMVIIVFYFLFARAYNSFCLVYFATSRRMAMFYGVKRSKIWVQRSETSMRLLCGVPAPV
jgi:hypothetical protein